MVELRWEARGVLRKLSGLVTAKELESSAIRLQADSRLDNMRYVIHDFTGVTDVMASQDDIDIMAARASVSLHRHPVMKIAFVGSHPVVQRLVDAFLNLDGYRHQCHRFDTTDQARKFIAAR